jgi:hypothetical protein
MCLVAQFEFVDQIRRIESNSMLYHSLQHVEKGEIIIDQD